jgi:hypothetical protein
MMAAVVNIDAAMMFGTRMATTTKTTAATMHRSTDNHAMYAGPRPVAKGSSGLVSGWNGVRMNSLPLRKMSRAIR